MTDLLLLSAIKPGVCKHYNVGRSGISILLPLGSHREKERMVT